VRGKAVRRNDVIDQSLNVGKPEAPLDAQLAGISGERPSVETPARPWAPGYFEWRARCFLASAYSSTDPRCLLVQTSPELGEFSLSAMEHSACLVIRDVVVIDQSDEFRDLITYAPELSLEQSAFSARFARQLRTAPATILVQRRKRIGMISI